MPCKATERHAKREHDACSQYQTVVSQRAKLNTTVHPLEDIVNTEGALYISKKNRYPCPFAKAFDASDWQETDQVSGYIPDCQPTWIAINKVIVALFGVLASRTKSYRSSIPACVGFPGSLRYHHLHKYLLVTFPHSLQARGLLHETLANKAVSRSTHRDCWDKS